MQTVAMRDLASSWGFELPPAEAFWALADTTALRHDDEAGTPYRSNYERGPLVYALVRHYQPKVVLEIGTGGGYSALCMAWALCDAGLPGRIYTVDSVGHDEVLAWWLDRHDGRGPLVDQVSRAQVWSQVARPEWLARIELLHGSVADRVGDWHGPRVDLAIIGGDHTYDGVRHDLYSVVDVCADRVGLLFDDYSGRDEFGVDRLVDDEVAPRLDCTVLTNDGLWAAGGLPSCGHAMAWATGQGPDGWLTEAFGSEENRSFVAGFRRRERVKTWGRQIKRMLGR